MEDMSSFKNLLGIDVKIMVGDDITETLNPGPIDLRIIRQKVPCVILSTFFRLSPGDEEHGYTIESFHSFRRARKVIRTTDALGAISYLFDCFVDLNEYGHRGRSDANIGT